MRRLSSVLAVAAAVVSLWGCGFFSATLFPDFLSGVVASRDLSAQMDDLIQGQEFDWDADVGVLRDASGTDYVFVLVWAFRGSRIVALDGDLRILGSFDNAAYGRRLMTDDGDRFNLGNVVLDNPPTAIVDSAPAGDVLGFSSGLGGTNYLLWVDGGVLPNNLDYQTFSGTTTGAVRSAAVEGTYTGSWFLYGAVYDSQQSVDREVILFLRREQDNSLRVLFLPLTAFTTASVQDYLFTSYPGFTIDVQKPRRVHYTRRGIVVRSEEDRQSAVFALDGERIADLDTDGRHDVRGDYDRSGRYFYYLDKDARILFKGANAW